MPAGAISAIYMGAVRMAVPTPNPPQMRATTNIAKLVAKAAVNEEARNRAAASSNTVRRPKRSFRKPAARLPAIAPQPRLLTAQPNCRPRRTAEIEIVADEGHRPRNHRGIKPNEESAQRHRTGDTQEPGA